MTYNHLLIAVDLTSDGHKVIERAEALVGCCAAKLSLIHVLEPVSAAVRGEVPVDVRTLHQEHLAQAQQQLDALLASHPQLTKENTTLLFGKVGEEVHRLAAALGCDLIVTGNHGRHGLALLAGSTANEVLHGATCDVLAVHLPKK